MPLECYDLTLISNSCWVGSCGDKLASGYEDKAGKCLEKLATCKKKTFKKNSRVVLYVSGSCCWNANPERELRSVRDQGIWFSSLVISAFIL